MSKEKSEDMESDDLGKYAPVVYAHSFEQADWYCQLLEDHDIPAIMDEDYEPPPSRSKQQHSGVPILVPESMLADARECISQLDQMEGICDDDDGDESEDEFGPADGFETECRNDDEENEYF